MARKPCANAYKLLPVAMYDGEITLAYDDRHAIEKCSRNRSDMTGLVVSVKGELMVCAEPVQFIMGLPESRLLAVSEALAYD